MVLLGFVYTSDSICGLGSYGLGGGSVAVTVSDVLTSILRASLIGPGRPSVLPLSGGLDLLYTTPSSTRHAATATSLTCTPGQVSSQLLLFWVSTVDSCRTR